MERHKNNVDNLKKEIASLSGRLLEVKTKNKTDEEKMRDMFNKALNNYQETLSGYDADMREHHTQKDKAQLDHDETHHELN